MAGQPFDLQRLKRNFLGVSGLYMMGIPLLLLANIMLARTLSVAEFGAFGFALSLATVLAIPVSGGLPMLLTREVAGYVQQNDWDASCGLIVTAFRWIAWVCVVIGLGFAGWAALVGGIPGPQLLIAFLLVPFLGANAVRNGILKGLGRPLLAEAPQQVLQPSLLIAGYLSLAALGLTTATHALWWYLSVVGITFALASVMLWRVLPAQLRGASSDMSDLPRWRSAIVPFVMLSAANVLSTQIAVLILGFNGMEEAVAQMRVAERGAQLVAYPLTFINSIIGPYFVQSLKIYKDSGDKWPMRRMTRLSALLTLAASLPVALVLVLFGKPLLALTFGTPYDMQSYLPMLILIGAQVLSVCLGNGGMLLAMGGYERQTLYSLMLSLVVILGAAPLLIGPYGVTGAALAAGTGVVASKIYVYVAVRRRYGIASGIV
jgi:O-antigen/teichoic acid export membrane protein